MILRPRLSLVILALAAGRAGAASVAAVASPGVPTAAAAPELRLQINSLATGVVDSQLHVPDSAPGVWLAPNASAEAVVQGLDQAAALQQIHDKASDRGLVLRASVDYLASQRHFLNRPVGTIETAIPASALDALEQRIQARGRAMKQALEALGPKADADARLAAVAPHALSALEGLAPAASPRYERSEVAAAVDIAETNLRLLVNEPARGWRASPTWLGMLLEDRKADSAMRLLDIERHRPGLLERQTYADWPQYDSVRRLFGKLASRHGIDTSARASIPDREGTAYYEYHADRSKLGRSVRVDIERAIDEAWAALFSLIEAPRLTRGRGAKIEQAMKLLGVQLRFPGLLEGEYKVSNDLAQHYYSRVQELFRQLLQRYQLSR